MHNNLHNLMGKYKEMTRRIGSSSLVEHLLSTMYLFYSADIKMAPLLPKFNVPQFELYNRSRDLVEHLKMFKAHMTLHDF